MTYAASAAKTYGKRPIWLYKIELGSSVAYYTSRASEYETNAGKPDASFAGDTTWTASPIRHSAIVQTASINRALVNIVAPRSDTFFQSIRDAIGSQVTKITIWHGYLDDPDLEFVAKYVGRVVSVKPNFVSITLACENRFTVMRRKGLAAVMQRPCRHSLFHGGCGLNIALFEVAATATALTETSLTVTEASAQADGYYAGGVATFNGNRQMIVKHTGMSVKLLGPIFGLAEEIISNGSAAVQIAPGCNLTTGTCNDVFDNLNNFGGFPFLTDTPYDGRNPF